MTKRIMGKKLRFFSPEAIKFFNYTKSKWTETTKKIKKIIFLPCASTKPIQNSLTHCYLSPITRLYDKKTLIVIVSEPLTLIPYTATSYPNYDYPPEESEKNEEEHQEFINRLQQFKEITPENIKCYYIGGIHHYNILLEAGWKIEEYYRPKKGILDYRNKALELRNDLFHNKSYKKIKFSIKKLTKKDVVLKTVIF